VYFLLNSLPKRKICLTGAPKEIDQPKIVILGIGNLLLKDEGLGIHFVRMLNQDVLDYANVEIIDGGLCPEFVSFIEDAYKLIYKLIIVDAIKGGKEPGTVYCFRLDDVKIDLPVTLSSHQMSVIDSLRLLKLMGREPRNTVIIGVEPKDIDCGLELSPEVKARLVDLKRIVADEVKKVDFLP
jgi:hydrogenase maturation protease